MNSTLDYFAIAASLFVIWMGMGVARMGQRSERPTLKRNLQLLGGAQAALGLGAMLMGMSSKYPGYFFPLLAILVVSVPITRHLIHIIVSRDANASVQ